MFFPQYEVEGFETGPGISKSLVVGDQKIVMLDNRFFRNKNKKLPYIGTKQWQWLMTHIEGVSKNIWLAGGNQFFGGYRSRWGESFEGKYDDEFQLLIDKFADSNKAVAFLSGDIHATELMKIEENLLGYETIEFTTSGIVRKDFKKDYWKRRKNPRQIESYSAGPNYGIVDSAIDKKNSWQFRVQALGVGNRQLYKRSFTIDLPLLSR